MLSTLYLKSTSEQLLLTAFCQNVLKDSFWPVEEFHLSLKIPQTFLIYRSLTEASENEAWQAFALGRVMGGVSELFFIFVHPDFRGTGLARALLTDFEFHSRVVHHAESVMLEVRVSNLSAIRLYENSGYGRIHTRKRYYQDGEDAYVYAKQLPPEGASSSKEGLE